MTSSGQSVLLIEDDVRLAELIRGYLESNHMRVTVEHRGDRALERVRAERPDLVILDIGLPGQDGFSVCRALRPEFAAPILILTARDSDIDQVLGLEIGADDYVVKPVEPRVLLARIHALLRRSKSRPTLEHRTLTFGRLSIQGGARTVQLADRSIALSSHEFDLLMCLAANAGVVQSRDKLYQQLYKRDYDGLDRTLDVRVSHLRRKLGDDEHNAHIKTVWGQGYLFSPEPW